MDQSNDWIGGHPAGCITLLKKGKGYCVHSLGEKSKSFSLTKYNDLESAKAAAEEHKKLVSEQLGLTVNMYRHIDDYIEFSLGDGLTGKIDSQDFDVLKSWKWKVKDVKGVLHICTGNGKDLTLLYKLIRHDDVTHRDGNGLDNRSSNLVKPENAWIEGNPIGSIRRVDRGEGLYTVSIQSEPSKTFSVSKFDSDKAAEQAAKNYRQMKSRELGCTTNPYRYMPDGMEILLEDNKIARFDREDIRILKHVWSLNHQGNHEFACMISKKKTTLMHNFVSKSTVRHRTKNTLDNRKSNLQKVTRSKKRSNLEDLSIITKALFNWKQSCFAKNVVDGDSEWQGGNPKGCLSLTGKVYIVRFQGDKAVRFPAASYDSLNDAKLAAEEYQKTRSNELDLTTNDYRFTDSYIEFRLPGGYTGKIDCDDLALLRMYRWSAKDSFKRTYASGCIGANTKNCLHNLLCPQWKEVDHINRDGLDNRRSNLRDGSNCVNMKNQSCRKDNGSGKTGVHFENYSESWCVQWPEDGKRKKKRFSSAKFGDTEKAKKAAVQFRMDLDKRLNIRNGYASDEEE
jgi:hypothetical protein